MTNRILTTAAGAPVGDNQNSITAGPRGPIALQDFWLIEKLAHFDREVIPERRVHAKGSGAFGTLTVTHDISRFTKAKVFSEVGKQTPLFMRFSTVAGERGAADAGRRRRHRGLAPADVRQRHRDRARQPRGGDRAARPWRCRPASASTVATG